MKIYLVTTEVLGPTQPPIHGYRRHALRGVKRPGREADHSPPALLADCFMLVSCLAYFSTLEMEVTCSSETPVDLQRTTPRYIPEDRSVLHPSLSRKRELQAYIDEYTLSVILRVVTYIRQVAAGFPPRRPGLDPRSCGICGAQSGTGAGFLRVFRFPLPILIPPTAPYSLIIL
jgi:hypothetical protein